MKSFNKIIILILSVNFLFSLYSVFLLQHCNTSPAYDCLWNKEGLFGDIYYNYNTIKYTGVHGSFPDIGIPNDIDGGFDGASVYGNDTRIIYHSPLYYYFAGFIYVLAKSININDLLVLHVFSTVIFLFTNILFFFLVKKISKYFLKRGKEFIIYSLALFMFLPTPLHVSISVQPDGMFYLSVIASFLMYFHFIENKSLKNAFWLGIVVGSSVLISLGGLVVLFALFSYTALIFLKKKYEHKKLVIFSSSVAFVLGVIPLIRNYVLTGIVYGDMHSRSPYIIKDLPKFLYRLYRGGKVFWTGIYGGLPQLKLLLLIIGVLLTLLTVIGLIFYFKKLRKKIDLDFIILTYVFTIILLVLFTCNPFTFLKTGVCYGREIQDRYTVSLAPMIPLFATMALISIQKKKSFLKYFVYTFIILTCLVFITEFITALI